MIVKSLVFTLLVSTVVAGLPARADGPKKGPAKKSDEVFGYTAAFDEELQKIGQITPEEFARRFAGKARYLDKLSWDPTTGKFYDQFQGNPASYKSANGGIGYDFRMNAAELDAFKRNGFVVSERMGAASFSQQYYRIYSRDLPVFVTADSILHAWHRSYDAMLEQLEETYLAISLGEILAGMTDGLAAAKKEYGDGVLETAVLDADYFLAVARSLLEAKNVATRLDQDKRVAETLGAIESLAFLKLRLFGREREVDFSQFKVRGHYENSELLKKYFKAMMWCGRMDLRVAGNPQESSPRELGAAVVLHDLLHRSGKFEQWQQFDRMIQTFVGKTDSMTFAQLAGILAEANIKSPADLKAERDLAALKERIDAGKLGLQHIRGDSYISPFGPEKIQLPRSFTVLGQKFVMDSWATAKVVYDDVLWNDVKVPRRIPSALDVAFAALGNDQVVPELVTRMNARDGREFRDGLNYQHNLAAVRNVIDRQSTAAWDENLYTHWLACLRELSKPTTGPEFPEALRTQAWAMKTLNTQLASWTQLRHDTILYAKQSYTGRTLCYYPAGFVEPVPHFWARMETMANRAAELIEKTPFPDRKTLLPPGYEVQLSYFKDIQAKFFRNFAKQVGVLKDIAGKELAQKELTKTEADFLKTIVEIQHRGSGGPYYTGWYYGLFYKGVEDGDKWDALVADVHTDLPDEIYGDPGCVLHQGVGNVDLIFLAVDNGPDRMVYAGPTLSHYEFEMPGTTRKSDSEWRKDIREGRLAPRPSWTKAYLVPGVNPDAKDYQHSNDQK